MPTVRVRDCFSALEQMDDVLLEAMGEQDRELIVFLEECKRYEGGEQRYEKRRIESIQNALVATMAISTIKFEIFGEVRIISARGFALLDEDTKDSLLQDTKAFEVWMYALPITEQILAKIDDLMLQGIEVLPKPGLALERFVEKRDQRAA